MAVTVVPCGLQYVRPTEKTEAEHRGLLRSGIYHPASVGPGRPWQNRKSNHTSPQDFIPESNTIHLSNSVKQTHAQYLLCVDTVTL